MDKLIRLPPGFRFHPTDEELVVQYLKRKALSCPLPASIIPEIDLGKYDPWELPGCYGGEKYFFNLQEAKHRKGSRVRQATRSGYWKTSGKDRPVVASKHNEMVGMKRVLVFYQGKPPYGSRTDWIMHEYRLPGSENAPYDSFHYKITTHCNLVQGQDWVVCRIFMKKRAAKMEEERAQHHDNLRVRSNHVVFITTTQMDGDSAAAASCSSCMTDLSEDECTSGEEASSKHIARCR